MASVALPEPYRLADKTLAALNKKIVLRFNRAKRALLHDGFDELTVFRSFEDLYKGLIQDNDDAFRGLCADRYREMYLYLKRSWPDRERLDDLVEMYLANLLTEPNGRTHYAYDSESLRKRDRAVEAINSETQKSKKDLEFEKAMRYWSQQTGFYIDIIADEMAVKAMKDCGVKRVRWRTQTDDKVCNDCHDRDGVVYDIDEVPDKHLRCRCWLEPIATTG